MKRKARSAGKSALMIPVRIVLAAVVVFAVVKAVQMHRQISEKQDQLRDINEQIAMAELYNEDLREKSENYAEYMKERLREAGYVYSSDQVYQFAN